MKRDNALEQATPTRHTARGCFRIQQQHWARKDTAVCSLDFKESLLVPEVTWGAGNSAPGAYVNSQKGEDHSSVLLGTTVGSGMRPGMSGVPKQMIFWEMPGLVWILQKSLGAFFFFC